MKLHAHLVIRPILALCLAAATAAAGPPPVKQQAGEAGARALLEQFVRQGADAAALTRQLRPTSADYKAVFAGAVAAQAEAAYKPAWDSGALVIAPKEGQTELKLVAATTEELKTGGGAAREFPGGYARIAPHLNKGLTIYRFKFVAPGESAGLAYDGLVFVNGRWVIFPKPFRVLDKEPEAPPPAP